MFGLPLKYNIRHLFVRRVGTLMTALGIALPTGVFCAVEALNNGLTAALMDTGSENTIVFIRKSSRTETNSSVQRSEAPIIEALDGIEKDKDGKAIVSREVMVLLNLPRVNNNGNSNVAIRGMSPAGRELRAHVQLRDGSWPREGMTEVAVAKSISDRFENCKIGDSLPLGKRNWKVVGIFDAGTTAYNSEIWGDAETIAGAFLRDAWSAVWVRARSGELKTAKDYYDSGAIPKDLGLSAQADSKTPKITSVLNSIGMEEVSKTSEAGLSLLLAPKRDPQLKSVDAVTERDYFRKQTELGSPIAAIGQFIAVFMAVGAAFAVMNTMYAAVASRSREIAVLRAIGFKRRAILVSFMIESVLLSILGGALGAIISFAVNGVSTGTTNFATFSELTFAFQVTPRVILDGFLFGAVLGVLGGLLPAIQASRATITQAMRAI
ncbi:MAG: ABC transporter permease [Planctomycetota bacterium]